MMDYKKKKLLTQSVSFIQAHLSLTTDLLLTFKRDGVLTGEEVSTIQKDDTPSGKVLELVCLLKRKDNRTYTRFLQVLDETGCSAVSDLLKAKGSLAEDQSPDPRLVHHLQTFLPSASTQAVRDLSTQLILRQVHNDELAALHDQISVLQNQLHQAQKASSAATKSTSSLSSDGSGRSTPASSLSSGAAEGRGRPLSSRSALNSSAAVPVWDVPSPQQEMDRILRQKDDILKRREEEYVSLKGVLTSTQNDLSAILDLNTQYLGIIAQLNHLNASATPRVTEATRQMEQDLEDARLQVEQLEEEIGDVSEKLTTSETELQKVKKRENRYKAMVGLGPEATEDEVQEKIQEIIQEGTMRKTEVERIKKELTKMSNNRNELADKISTLGRDKEKIEFHMRQQELTMRKMKRMKTAGSTIANAESMLAAHGLDRAQQQQLRLPFIERPGSQISLAKQRTTQQYCVFCRTEYQPMKAPNCRFHFRPIRSGRWVCCKDESHRSAGCLQVPHFYVEITAEKKILLTDGGRYMEIT